jgi:hypothetical protein
MSLDTTKKVTKITFDNVDFPINTKTPTGTFDVSENGKYNIADYELVDVHVESGGGSGPALSTDTSGTTATADSVLKGYVFHDKDGELSTGTIETMSGGTFTSNQKLNTANKYLTSDIIVNVPNGDTRIENDSMYRMRALDIVRVELGESSYLLLPKEAEYLEEQAIIDDVLKDHDLTLSNFIQYSTIGCANLLRDNLSAHQQYVSDYIPLDSLVNAVSRIGKDYTQPIKKVSGVSDTTVTPDKVRLGRLFYRSSGELDKGLIDSIVGRTVDVNQTIPTANKYVTSDIEICVPSDTNPNETLIELMSTDMVRYCLNDIGYADIPSIEEYEKQQMLVNDLIYNIQGVKI